jgi:hypothetical protein
MVDQRKRERFCGYCNKKYEYDMEEFMAHLHICEEVLVAQHRKNKKP